MRYIALCVAIAGIFVLIGLLVFTSPRVVDDLEGLRVKERVIVQGVVSNERMGESYTSFIVNNVSVRCTCKGGFEGTSVRVEGFVEEYQEKRYLRALSVEEIEVLR